MSDEPEIEFYVIECNPDANSITFRAAPGRYRELHDLLTEKGAFDWADGNVIRAYDERPRQ